MKMMFLFYENLKRLLVKTLSRNFCLILNSILFQRSGPNKTKCQTSFSTIYDQFTEQPLFYVEIF